MQANWFPEHLEAGAKIFEAEIAKITAPRNGISVADQVSNLKSHAADLRKYIALGAVEVRKWIENEALIKRKMTPEGARLLGIKKKHMNLSVGIGA